MGYSRAQLFEQVLDMATMRPLDREQIDDSLHDEIYRVMRKALMVGGFVPGQVLPMRMLAKRFGTSLIPVRDALMRLASEQALATLPNRMFAVPRMPKSRFRELLQIRLCLEPVLAQQAVALISDETLRRMEEVNQTMQQAVPDNDVHGYLSANKEFHFILYSAAEREAFLQVIENLWLQIGPFLNGVFTTLGFEIARDNHAQILSALARRDVAEAGRAVANDLSDAAELILRRDDFWESGD